MSIKRAFSLVELLVVILIVSLGYGIIYNMALKERVVTPQEDKQKLIYSIKSHPLYKKEKIWLFCNEDNECFVGKLLANRLQEFSELEIKTPYTSYKFDKYSDLIPYSFYSVRVNRFLFNPYIIIECDEKGIIKNHFLQHNDKWWYYSSYEDKYLEFINMNDAIMYSKKANYLPYLAGDANENQK